MTPNPTAFPTGTRGPRSSYSTGETLVGAVALSAAVVAAALAVMYPAVAVGAVLLAVVAWPAVRTARRLRRFRRREGRTRSRCVPNTDVCVEA